MDYSQFKCKWMSKTKIWEVAERVRNRYWPENSTPVDVESIIEFRMKITIDVRKGLLSTIDMDAFLRLDLTGIIVDEDSYMQEKFASRLRFSFAHELGHYFLHRGTYTAADMKTLQEWKEFILNVPDEEYRNFEWQANEFAGRFLVPRPRLEIEVDKVTEIILRKGWKKHLEKDPEAVLSRVSTSICKAFGVSSEVIETRVRREGLWPPII